jgi:acyl-CoA synthetase (AMP-forming)/AMP-acid ligase II
VPPLWKIALKMAKPPRGGTLARVHVGSAPLSAGIWEQVQQWTGTREVFNAYGITETGSWVAGTTGGDVVPEDGLIGEPWGAVIKILSTRSTESPLSPDFECARGTEGFVWLNTPALMRGYLDRDDLTDASVRDGWFLTGDIGVLDERGRLYLRGRERDEINKGGVKIYPADIEAVVERFPGATDVCAFGFEDRIYGENVGLAVVLQSADAATVRALHEWMKRHLAEHKLPVRWHVVDEIPRTSRGKVNRGDVMRSCLSAAPYDLAAAIRDGASKP